MSIVIGNKTVSDIQIVNKTVERIEIGGKTAYELRTLIASPFRVVNNIYQGTNTCTLTKNGSAPDVNLEYSFDNTNWTTWVADANGVRTISIPQNGNLYLRGENPNGFSPNISDTDYYSFTCSENYALAGDIDSLVSRYEAELLPVGCFNNFFKDSTTLRTTHFLRLPCTVLKDNAYRQMFMGCNHLSQAPCQLPQIDCVNDVNPTGRCYTRMFCNCTSLTTMPIIKATGFGRQSCYEMFKGCSALVDQWTSTDPSVSTKGNIGFVIASDNEIYDSNNNSDTFHGMFQNCTSLINASNITATKTNSWIGQVFHSMFYGCTSLTSAPNITIGSVFANTTAHCHSMFYGCTSLTTVSNIKLDATIINASSYKQMFYGCTSLTTAPEIMATTLATGSDTNNGSLAYMFYGCSNLASIKVHFTNWNSGNYTKGWTNGTKSTGTFYKPSSLASTKNTSGNTTNPHYIPYNWTVTNI